MQRPAREIELVCQATRGVLRTLAGLTDEQVGEPSRLTGWTRAEVATHLARNADGMRGMAEAARRGEVAAMYPSAEARAEGIAAGRGAGAAAVLADVRDAHDRMVAAWDALPDDAWERTGRVLSGSRTMREFVAVRWREVEIHHVDLDAGYEASDWPVAFVKAALDDIMATFAKRAVSARPLLDLDYRVVSTDDDRAWRVQLRGATVTVVDDDGSPVAGEASGWGCDIAAWLYGRDPRGGGVLATGDAGVLRLPRWFPFG